MLRESLADDPLRREIIASFPAAEGAYARLYALGVDAWRIIESLEALGAGERRREQQRAERVEEGDSGLEPEATRPRGTSGGAGGGQVWSL